MIKKVALILTLTAFIIFTFSCTSIKKIRVHEHRKEKIGRVKILTVYTKSKKLFEFSEKEPAKIVEGKIVGYALYKPGEIKKVSIPLSDAKIIWVKKISSESIILMPLAIIGVAFSALIALALVGSG